MLLRRSRSRSRRRNWRRPASAIDRLTDFHRQEGDRAAKAPAADHVGRAVDAEDDPAEPDQHDQHRRDGQRPTPVARGRRHCKRQREPERRRLRRMPRRVAGSGLHDLGELGRRAGAADRELGEWIQQRRCGERRSRKQRGRPRPACPPEHRGGHRREGAEHEDVAEPRDSARDHPEGIGTVGTDGSHDVEVHARHPVLAGDDERQPNDHQQRHGREGDADSDERRRHQLHRATPEAIDTAFGPTRPVRR